MTLHDNSRTFEHAIVPKTLCKPNGLIGFSSYEKVFVLNKACGIMHSYFDWQKRNRLEVLKVGSSFQSDLLIVKTDLKEWEEY